MNKVHVIINLVSSRASQKFCLAILSILKPGQRFFFKFA